MKLIEGLTDQPKQQSTLILSAGTKVIWSLEYRPLQLGWFYDLSWNGNTVVTGQRLIASPNILRQLINVIPFGIAVVTADAGEPDGQETFVDGTTQLFLLEGSDLTDIEAQIYGGPEVPQQPVGTTGTGQEAVIPPESWGPAGGDLSGTYPNPKVVAIHEGGGQQLTVGPIADGQFVKRVGSQLQGANSSGTGDVVGPGSSINDHFPQFNGTTGKLIKDGGYKPSDFDAAGTAASAVAALAATLGTAATHYVPASGNAGPTEVVLGNDTRLTGGGASPWFNVKNYGATGSGTTDDTAAINSACTAAAAANGTVFFPDGVYKITAAITLTATGSVAIRGTSRFAAIILAATNSINAIHVDLSGGTPKQNRVEVCDLGFHTAASITPNSAVYVDYGASNIASSENQGGSWVHDLEIWNNASDSGGYINGVIMRNCWHSFVTDIYGYGSASGYNASGAGSGAMIRYQSAVNYTISRIQGDFWNIGIRLEPVSASTAGQDQIAQGVQMDQINFVETITGLSAVSNNNHDYYDYITCTNFQFDLGNINSASHRSIYIEYCVNLFLDSGLCLQNNGPAIVELNNCVAVFMEKVNMSASVNNPSYALKLSGNSNGNRVLNCGYDLLPIDISAGSGSNVINNTAGSTITDAGGGNIIGDIRIIDHVVTLSGGTSTSFNLDISSCGLAHQPPGMVVRRADGVGASNTIACDYDYSNGGNSATNAVVAVWATSGSLPSGPVRFYAIVGPGIYN